MQGRVTFDHAAFFDAIERQRTQQHLSWKGLADAVWDQSKELNQRRNDHPISVQAIRHMGTGTSCQHALFVLRWLNLPPEALLSTRIQTRWGLDCQSPMSIID
jgi:hypothetical protein